MKMLKHAARAVILLNGIVNLGIGVWEGGFVHQTEPLMPAILTALGIIQCALVGLGTPEEG